MSFDIYFLGYKVVSGSKCYFGLPLLTTLAFRSFLVSPNRSMASVLSSVRVTVEWLFGDIINDFKFLDSKRI